MAFPNGIPEEIWTGQNRHIVSTGTDNGIVFSQLEKPTSRRRSILGKRKGA